MVISNFSADLSGLKRKREIGVSGLMRVKNDADFILYSIESCISALDELVIVYQKSSDETEKKILEAKNRYPLKIKVYYYEPEVYSHDLSDEQIAQISKYPNNSVHLLSNYYNYALLQVNYKYVLKIDADQVYCTEKLSNICSLYREEKHEPIFINEYLIYQYYYLLIRIFSKIPLLLNQFTARFFFPKIVIIVCTNYVRKKILNEKVVSSYSGINVFKDNGKIMIPLGTFYNKVQPPINGSGDHLIFELSEETFYLPYIDRSCHRIIEVMKMKEKVFWGGFLWLHLNPMRRIGFYTNLSLYREKSMVYEEFLSTNLFEIEKRTKFRIESFMRTIIYTSLKIEKVMIMNTIQLFFNKWK